MDKYTQLYAWTWFSFRDEPFTIDAFRSVFPTRQAPKVIHDMVKAGYLQREARGRYRAVEPEKFVGSLVQISGGMELVQEARMKYAFCESTAIALWTDGYYWTGFTRGFRPVHIRVKKGDLPKWEEFFRSRKAKFSLDSDRETLYGPVYILHPVKDFSIEEKEGLKVIPLKEAVRYCIDYEAIYAPALEYLDKNYGVGYKKREHVVT